MSIEEIVKRLEDARIDIDNKFYLLEGGADNFRAGYNRGTKEAGEILHIAIQEIRKSLNLPIKARYFKK